MSSFVRIDGSNLCKDGKPLALRGFNYGNWMLIESYMIGIPWTEYKMRAAFREILGEDGYHSFFDTFMDTFAAEEDFAFLERSGFNLLQLPFNYRHFGGDATAEPFGERGFEYFDRFIELCRSHNIYVVLGLHAAAGCQVRDWNAESAHGEAFMWEHHHFWERTAKMWQAIAQRYRNEEVLIGYEILNEPLAPDLDTFHRFNMEMLRAIREIDENHVIIVSANRWGQDIDSLRPEVFDDPQVMPSTHFYHSLSHPFGDLTEYPGEYEGRRYGHDELINSMKNIYDDRLGRPLLIGECGVPMAWNHHSDALMKMFDDVLAFFNRKNFAWTSWAYKDLGALGMVSPKADTPWRQFLARDDVRMLQERSGFFDHFTVLKEKVEASCPFLSTEDMALFGHQVRHQWDAMVLPHFVKKLKDYSLRDLEAMARSFAFENCDVHLQKQELLVRRAADPISPGGGENR